MKILQYDDSFKDEVIAPILDIQNNEAGINLSLAEQPDLSDITGAYMAGGGNFWVAVDAGGQVIGTLALMMLGDGWAVLKKFFVRSDYRSHGVGLALYEVLLDHASRHRVRHIILDTPSVAVKSHAFYERAGFRRIDKTCLPVRYEYPDRDSLLYRLDLQSE